MADKRILHQFKMRALSTVDKPAQEPALAVLMKMDQSEAFAKAAFAMALVELELNETVCEAIESMWQLNDALRNSVYEIAQNPDRYPEPIIAMRDSLKQFAAAVATMIQVSIDELDTNMLMGKSSGFKEEDFALVPDPNDPTTWKFLLTSTPGGDPEPRIVKAAVLALGDDFRKKVQIGTEQMPKVKARVRQAYTKALPGASLPEILKSATQEEDEMAKTLEQLQSDLERAESFGRLNDIEKSHFAKLDSKDQDNFLKMSATDRAGVLQKSAEADAVVYTATNGETFRKSDDQRMVSAIKRADEQEKLFQKEREAREIDMFTKRADTELSNLPGDANVKVAVLKAISTITDDVTRTSATALLKAGNEAIKAAFTKVGVRTTGDPGATGNALEVMTRKRMTADPKMTFEQAQAAVLETPEGEAAYEASL